MTITGKSGTDSNGNPVPSTWLNVSGRYNDTKILVVCVPNIAVGAEYKFDVTVENIGTLDPRVKVVDK